MYEPLKILELKVLIKILWINFIRNKILDKFIFEKTIDFADAGVKVGGHLTVNIHRNIS